MGTDETARILGVAEKTVRAQCRDGRLPGAKKTSEKGEWRIPASSVYGGFRRERRPETTPKLWRQNG